MEYFERKTTFTGFIIYTSYKRSVARRVTVLLTHQTLVIMFVILSKESFKKKAVRYSIKQRIKLLLLQKEANTTMQWSQVKTFEFVFIACRQFFFVLFLWDKFWCFYHFSVASNLSCVKLRHRFIFAKYIFHGNIYTNIYIPMKSSILSLTKYAIFM